MQKRKMKLTMRMKNRVTQPARRRNSLVREDVVVAWKARE